MSGKELFEGMSYVDERFVDEAEHKTIAKHVTARWIKITSMAACLCLVLFSMYKLIPYWDWSVTEQAAGEAAEARPEGAVESEMGMEEQESAAAAAPASISGRTSTALAGTSFMRLLALTLLQAVIAKDMANTSNNAINRFTIIHPF